MSLFFTLLNRKVIRQQYCAVLFSAVICSRGYLSSDPAHRLSQAPPRLGFVCAGATRQRVLLASPVTAGDKLLLDSSTYAPVLGEKMSMTGVVGTISDMWR